jgi:hypothetical protein
VESGVAVSLGARDARASVEPLGSGLHVLSLEGRLTPGWAGNLAAGLAERSISIERGEARASRLGCWSARFEVRPLAGAPTLAALDLVALARTDAGRGFATPLRLHAYELDASDAHGGSLRLAVSAPDCVGFLAGLLRRLAYFALFPVALRLETQQGGISDELWLRGAGQRVPSANARAALGRALAAHAGLR